MTKFINELTSETAILLLQEKAIVKDSSDLSTNAQTRYHLETTIRTALNDNNRALAIELYAPPSSIGTGVYKLYYEGPAKKLADYVKKRIVKEPTSLENTA